MDTDAVTDAKLGYFGFELVFFDGVDDAVHGGSFSGRSISADAPRTQLPKHVSCYRKDSRYNARSAAPVVQLDRATASGAVGCAFEPRRAHSDPEWHLAQRCDSAEQILFACHAGDLVADLSVFENEQRRDRTNVEFEREVLVLVDVHLADGKAT